MTTIFGYPTIKSEIVGLINKANVDFKSDFTEETLSIERGEFDTFESRQRFIVRDLSGRYYGERDDVGLFKRNFQTLFKGIELNVQTGSGVKNRVVLESLCQLYGLPPFDDSDFAPGLLDMSTDSGDKAVFVSWPIADTSWSWTGNVEFYLRNTKTSLSSIITDDLEAFDGNPYSGIVWTIRKTTANGLYYPIDFDLDQVIVKTELSGLEYPGDFDLGTLITVTDLSGLEYPPETNLNAFNADLSGLEYPPIIDLTAMTAKTLSGLMYPTGIGTNRYSALVITRPLDFSDYQVAIQQYRVGAQINDESLVNVIVDLIAANFSTMATESSKSRLKVAFTGAQVVSIDRVRTAFGWTETVTVQPSSTAFIIGQAVLRYDIEVV